MVSFKFIICNKGTNFTIKNRNSKQDWQIVTILLKRSMNDTLFFKNLHKEIVNGID